MCTGPAEPQGHINGEPVISKVGEYHDDKMGSTEVGGERACNSGNGGSGLLQRLHYHLTRMLPSLSITEVGNILTLSLPLLLNLSLLVCCSSRDETRKNARR